MPPGKKHEPTDATRRTVQGMAGFGNKVEEIAQIIGINRDTLAIHYREELDNGHILANNKVAQRLFKIATEADGREAVTACIFWLKTRARWTETAPTNDRPPEELSDAELARIISRAGRRHDAEAPDDPSQLN